MIFDTVLSILTYVEDALFDTVLPAVPKHPGLGVVLHGLVLAEDQHHHTLRRGTEESGAAEERGTYARLHWNLW